MRPSIIAACVVLLVMGSVAGADPFAITVDIGACNDFYLECGDGVENTGVWSLHGYEYGCSHDDRLADGSLVVTGGYAYMGINIQQAGSPGDQNAMGCRTFVITLRSLSGTYEYSYVYLSGGTLDAHDGSGSCSVSLVSGPPAKAGAAAGADESQ